MWSVCVLMCSIHWPTLQVSIQPLLLWPLSAIDILWWSVLYRSKPNTWAYSSIDYTCLCLYLISTPIVHASPRPIWICGSQTFLDVCNVWMLVCLLLCIVKGSYKFLRVCWYVRMLLLSVTVGPGYCCVCKKLIFKRAVCCFGTDSTNCSTRLARLG